MSVGGDTLGEVFFLHLDNTDEELYRKLVHLLSESGYQVNQVPCERADSERLSFEGLTIIPERYQVLLKGNEVALTKIEFEILLLLAKNRGRVFSKEQIYDIVWQEPYSGDYNIVMSHIRHIREKIEDNPGKPLYIQTVWGIGYRFNKNLSGSL